MRGLEGRGRGSACVRTRDGLCVFDQWGKTAGPDALLPSGPFQWSAYVAQPDVDGQPEFHSAVASVRGLVGRVFSRLPLA